LRLPAWMRAQLRWKLLLARLVVSTLAVVLAVVLVPGLSINGRFWLWAVVLGAVFAVLNGAVKPALLVLTIRYLFLSWGLVLLLVDIATLWLLEALVSPLDIDGVLSLVLGGLALGVLVPLLEALLGVSPPIVERLTPSVHSGAG
jgi:uncharacterized membrane protein YvlD (DUF360 family)